MGAERGAWWAGLLAAAPVAVWMLVREASGLGAGDPFAGPLADGVRALWVIQILVLTLLPVSGPDGRSFRRRLAACGAVWLAGLPVAALPWAAGALVGGTTGRAAAGILAYAVLASAVGAAGCRWFPDPPPLGRDLAQAARLLWAAGLWAWRGTWLPWLG